MDNEDARVISHQVTNQHAEKVCKMGQGAASCSFLSFSGDGFECTKGSAFEYTIRQKLAEGSMKSKGDNCSGAPDFTPTVATPVVDIEDKVGQALAEAGGLTGDID